MESFTHADWDQKKTDHQDTLLLSSITCKEEAGTEALYINICTYAGHYSSQKYGLPKKIRSERKSPTCPPEHSSGCYDFPWQETLYIHVLYINQESHGCHIVHFTTGMSTQLFPPCFVGVIHRMHLVLITNCLNQLSTIRYAVWKLLIPSLPLRKIFPLSNDVLMSSVSCTAVSWGCLA